MFGEILLKQMQDDEPVQYWIERDDNLLEIRDASLYFNPPQNWPKEELTLLNRLKSPALDIGCGAGRHSLFAEEKGIDVMALDISPGAIKVCNELGISRTIVGSIYEIEKLHKKYKSFILFGANIGLGASIEGTITMLNSLEKISEPEAIIIGDYFEPLPTSQHYHLSYHQKNRDNGKSIGELKFRIRYQNKVSDWVKFFAPTRSEFELIISKTNWELIEDYGTGRQHYVYLKLKI